MDFDILRRKWLCERPVLNNDTFPCEIFTVVDGVETHIQVATVGSARRIVFAHNEWLFEQRLVVPKFSPGDRVYFIDGTEPIYGEVSRVIPITSHYSQELCAHMDSSFTYLPKTGWWSKGRCVSVRSVLESDVLLSTEESIYVESTSMESLVLRRRANPRTTLGHRRAV